jgi:hypothetical protein
MPKTPCANGSRKRPVKPPSRGVETAASHGPQPRASSVSTTPIWPARIRYPPWWFLSMAVPTRPATAGTPFGRYRPRTITPAWPKCCPDGTERSGPANPEPDLLAGGRRKRAGEHRRCGAGSTGLTGRFAIAGIAKKDDGKKRNGDKIYLPNRANPVNLGSDGRLLLLLQQIRDEAHRFAITFQRKQRTRATIQSVLDEVPGVGPKRKAMLMKHFGSIKKIRAATVDELSELPGINIVFGRRPSNKLSEHKIASKW